MSRAENNCQALLPTRRFLAKNLKENRNEEKKPRFLRNCEFLELTRKNKRNVLIVSFLSAHLAARACLSRPIYVRFSTLSGHMIRYLLTKFGRTGRVNT